MFKHPHRSNAIKAPRIDRRELAVIAQLHLNRQAGAALADPAHLLGRHGDAQHLRAVMPSGEGRQGPPAATHIEQPHARPQLQLLADQAQFVLLRRRQIVRRAPVAAAVGHLRAQHRGIDARVDVVVAAADHKRAQQPLGIQQPIAQQADPFLAAPRQAQGAVGIHPQQPADQLIQLLTIPAAAHIALAESQGTAMEHVPVEAGVMHLQIPGAIAIETHISGCGDGGKSGRNRHGWHSA